MKSETGHKELPHYGLFRLEEVIFILINQRKGKFNVADMRSSVKYAE